MNRTGPCAWQRLSPWRMRFSAPRTKLRAGWLRRTARWAGRGPSTNSTRNSAYDRSRTSSTALLMGCIADAGVEALPGALPEHGLHRGWRTLRSEALESSGHGNGLLRDFSGAGGYGVLRQSGAKRGARRPLLA